MPKEKKVQIGFTVPESLAKEFKEACKEREVTYVSVLIRFMKGFITRTENKKKPE